MQTQNVVSSITFEQGLKDDAGLIWTPVGGASVVTTPKRDDRKCLSLNGSSQWLSAPSNPSLLFGASTDFSIEMFFMPTVIRLMYIVTKGEEGWGVTVRPCWAVRMFANGTVGFHGEDSVSSTALSSTNTVSLNRWNHLYIGRRGQNLFVGLNGIVTTIPYFRNADTNHTLFLGVGHHQTGGYAFNPSFQGFIDGFKITSGVAKWSENFRPPLSPDRVKVIANRIVLPSVSRL